MSDSRCRRCGAALPLAEEHGAVFVRCPDCGWVEFHSARRRLPKKLTHEAGAAFAALRVHEEQARQVFAHLLGLTERAFDGFCADLFEHQGYAVVRTDPAASDTHALELTSGRESVYVACRRCAAAHRVEGEAVENLAGAMRHDGAARAVFVTTGVFDASCGPVAEAAGIDLIDGPALARLLSTLEPEFLERHGAEPGPAPPSTHEGLPLEDA